MRSTPGLGTAAIARATGCGTTTAAGRLKRLRARHLIERDAGEGWRVSTERSRASEPGGLTKDEIADLLAPGREIPHAAWVKPIGAYTVRAAAALDP